MINKQHLTARFAGHIADESKFDNLVELYDTLSQTLCTETFPAVAVGLGLSSLSTQKAEPALIIHVARPDAVDQIGRHYLLRDCHLPIRVRITGPISSLSEVLLERLRPDSLTAGQEPFNRAYDKPPGGVSIGVKDIPHTGTLGFFAVSNTKTYLISCRHVLDMANTGITGELIQQQSGEDGNISGKHIATTSYIGYIGTDTAKNIDAGAALLDTSENHNPGQLQPNGTVKAIVREAVSPTGKAAVHKSGRTTGLTKGKVEMAAGTVTYAWSSGPLRTFNCFSVVGDAPPFSSGGDSGSLILDKDEHPMGMLFAGATDGSVTYAFTTEQVLAGLKAAAGDDFAILYG